LTNNNDSLALLNMIIKTTKTRFAANFDKLFEHLDLPDANGNKDGKVDTLNEMKNLLWTDV
jgi:dynein heavy chain